MMEEVLKIPNNTRTEEIHLLRRTHKHYFIHRVFFIIMAFLLGNGIYNQAPIPSLDNLTTTNKTQMEARWVLKCSVP